VTSATEQIITTACPHDCPDTCSMLATVSEGRLIRVSGNPQNPFTRGNLCRKVAHYEERVYNPDRVLYPMKRIGRKGEGRFERISWDAAIEEITGRWKQIIAESGPEAIQPYSYAGTMGVVQMSACDARLWNRMGASQLERTICSAAATVGYSYVYGRTPGIDPESFAQSKFIIAWGTNLSSTNVHQMPFIREAQANGATFVVIDPFKTRTANAADWFIQPKPGTDSALALGMAHVIFSEGLHDEAFLEAHSVGWRAFRERCAQYPPERVAQITGLDAGEIVALARRYATEQPSAIRLGYGMSRTANGGGMIRAIATLPAVIGAWGKPGSGLLLSSSGYFPINWRNVKRPDLLHSPDDESTVKWGRRSPRAINMSEIGKALRDTQDPPIRSLFVFNSNPAAVAPNSNLVREGLAREDIFTVVHEQMMSDTALYADILLPATTQMEHLDLMTAYGHLYVNLCRPAIAPLGEARPNLDVQNALAKAMGYTDSVFDETAEDVVRGALQSNHPWMEGITFEYLWEHGFAKLKTPSNPYVPYADGKFFTISGKVELSSQRAAKDGFDPLPDYQPTAESAEGNPELYARFPINLLSPAAHHFLNSTFGNVESLQKGERMPRIWIHAEDAEPRGIADGDMTRVWNRRGCVLLTAVVSDKVKPGVAWSPSLWWHRDSPDGANVNTLTSDALTDMGGGSTFHTNLVQIARVTEG
jgi:anaerobic selenocysteine-containing dehydrogenase